MTKAAKTIAKCDRCGRGFVWVNPNSDKVDHFAPERGSPVQPNADGECGGRIVPLEGEEP